MCVQRMGLRDVAAQLRSGPHLPDDGGGSRAGEATAWWYSNPMDLPDLTKQPAENLFVLFARVMDELRRRGLVRSSNNPVADYAEHLAAAALDLTLAGKSDFGYDG